MAFSRVRSDRPMDCLVRFTLLSTELYGFHLNLLKSVNAAANYPPIKYTNVYDPKENSVGYLFMD